MTISKDVLTNSLLDRGKFLMVPHEIWEVLDLAPLAKLIWMYVYTQKSDWKSSLSNIAKNTEMSINTVKKHLLTLEQNRMIKVDRDDSHGWNFAFPAISEWIDPQGNIEDRLCRKLKGEGALNLARGHLPLVPPGVSNLTVGHQTLTPIKDYPSSGFFQDEVSPNTTSSSYPSVVDSKNTHPESLESITPPPTILSTEDVIQKYLSENGGYDILKDRKSREDNLRVLVSYFVAEGYDEDDVLTSNSQVREYAVPSDVSSAKQAVLKNWKEDFKKQWAVTVKAVYQEKRSAEVKKVTERNDTNMNQETLNLDIDAILAE